MPRSAEEWSGRPKPQTLLGLDAPRVDENRLTPTVSLGGSRFLAADLKTRHVPADPP